MAAERADDVVPSVTVTEGRRAAVEWATVGLAIVIHAGWLAATWFHQAIPLWALAPIGGWLVAWHGSLQHETIHGHPTRHARVNALIGALPMALWLPYRCYRRDHIAHHATDKVTDPAHDSESRYLRPPRGRLDAAGFLVAGLQASLVGRLLIGPIDLVVRFLAAETRRLRATPGAVARDWLPHLIGLAAVAGWLALCQLSWGLYLLAFVYPGVALSLLRSFAEHRAAALPGHRIAIVERGGPFALLFLNNNLHAAHHRAPGVAWFRLPAFYRRHRAALIADNGGLLYRSYGEIVRRYGWRRHDSLIHPDWR